VTDGSLPDGFVGAWRRVSIVLGSGAPHEPSDVLWLQARKAFADLRLPRGRGAEPVAFAGVTSWDPPALTWRHRLDLAPCAPDVGTVEWRGADLIERGAMFVDGELTTYEEVWRRDTDARSPILVLTCDGEGGVCFGTIVRVADDAIVMARTERGLAARRDRRDGSTWRTVGCLGPRIALPAVPEARRDWEPGAPVRIAPVPAATGVDATTPGWFVRELEG
jgi:hypothetical protein